METNFCQCNDSFHSNNPYDGVCNMRISNDFTQCYFCFMGHKVQEKDNDASSGDDEIGYQKGEKVDFE